MKRWIALLKVLEVGVILLLVTGCSATSTINNNLSKLEYKDNTAIQTLIKELGEEYTIGDIISENSYYYEDYELVDGFFGKLRIGTENTLVTEWAWYLVGYTKERAKDLTNALKKQFPENIGTEVLIDEHREAFFKTKDGIIMLYEYFNRDDPFYSIHYKTEKQWSYSYDDFKKNFEKLANKGIVELETEG